MKFGKLIIGNVFLRVLNVITGILITLLLTRLLSVDGYGVLALVIANVSIFSLVSCLGSESGIIYHYSSENIRRGKLFAIIYTVIFIQFLLFIITELIHKSVTGDYWLITGKEAARLLWGIIYLLSVILIDKYGALLNAAHFYTRCNRIIFISNLLLFLFLAYFYFFKEAHDTFFYLQIFILATSLQAVLLMFTFHISARQALSCEVPLRGEWKMFFSYSFIVFFTNVLQFLAYRVDYWIIDFYHGKNSLGLYSLAMKLGQMLWVLPALFASIIFPLVADKEKKYDENNLFFLIRIANTSLLVLAILAFILAGWIIPFMIGEEYRPSVGPFLYLLPGLLLFCINIMLAGYFAGKGKLYINLIGSVICLTVVLLLDLWLIPLYDIAGAAIASSIAYTVSGLFHLWQFSGFRKSAIASIIIIQRKDWKMIRKYFKELNL